MSKQKTTIYLVRHGESESNKLKIISGHSDYDLTEQGVEQVKKTKQALKSIKFDEVYSSDLKRAVQTAEILFGKPVAETNKIHTLRERDFGSLDGQPEYLYHNMQSKRLSMSFEEGWKHKHLPDMESDHEVVERFLPTLKKIAESNFGKTVLVVAHGSAIRVVLMKVAGFTPSDLPPGSFGNAAYAELSYDSEQGFSAIQINGVRL